MDTNFFYFTVMLIPMLAGRSMVAVFSASFLLFLQQNEWLGVLDWFGYQLDEGALNVMSSLPDFATDPKFLIVTFILAILEKRISNSPSFQDLWNMHDAKVKGVFATIIAFVMVDETAEQIIKSVTAATNSEAASVESVFYSLESVWAAVVGGLTWLLAAIRSSILMFLIETDHDDSMGIRKFISRLEGLMGIFGPLLFLILPIIALSFAGIAFALVGLIKWRVRQVEKNHERPCFNCQHSNHLSALHCGNCDTELTNVCDVGFLGLSKRNVAAGDEKSHIQKLLEAHRCGYCAAKGDSGGVCSRCKTCDRLLFPSKQHALNYLSNMRKKIPLTLAITSVCGFFPIIGLIPGIIFYRLYLISGLKVHVSHSASFFIRLLLRVFFIFLVLFNMTPIFGFVSIPIMAMANYLMYTNAIRNQIHSHKYKLTQQVQGE
jgi:hypothetical protein